MAETETRRGRKSLSEVTGAMAREFANITPQSEREKLDSLLHFIPLNEDALAITLGEIIRQGDRQDEVIQGTPALRQFVARILQFVRKTKSTYKYKIKLTSNGILVSTSGGRFESPTNAISTYTPAVVIDGNKSAGLLFKNYDRTFDNLFRNFINKELTNVIYYEKYTETFDPNYPKLQETAKAFEKTKKKGFDIGHLLSQETYEYPPGSGKFAPLATSPQAQRLKELLSAIDLKLAGQTISSAARQSLEGFRQNVSSIQQDLYTKSSYGPRVEATLSKNTQDFLVSIGALVVIIQERVENQYKYGTLVESAAGFKILDLLLKLGHSTNAEEDIDDTVYRYLTTGKSNIKKNSKKHIKFDLPKKPRANVGKRENLTIAIPRSKTAGQQPTRVILPSIVSLQKLLDASLEETIKRNMGTGNRRDILNLRSGRFAESAKVNKLTQSKQGMVTAFYSYMRNPYATFSAGGKQQYPRTRDPKLLISKSIREVAQQLQITRLKAVLI